MTKILRISAFCHDSAAARVVDGEVVAAGQEQRCTARSTTSTSTSTQSVLIGGRRNRTQGTGSGGSCDKPSTRFKRRTDCPVMINTRLTVLRELIFRSPEHAFHCFDVTRRDAPGLQRFVMLQEGQPDATAHPLGEHLAQVALDLGPRLKGCAAVSRALHFVALLRTKQGMGEWRRPLECAPPGGRVMRQPWHVLGEKD